MLWTAWGRDWTERATATSVTADAIAGRLSGGTLLLHDADWVSHPGSWRATVGALPRLAEHVDAHGWEVGPLRDHGIAGGRYRGAEVLD